MNVENIAVLDVNNIVTNILVIDIDDFIKENNHIEYKDENPAIIGGDYFEGKFYPPKPYPSWIRNREKGTWEPPYFIDELIWDREKQEWITIGKWDEEKNTYTIKGWNIETQEWEDSILQRYNSNDMSYVTEIIKELPLSKD